VGIVEQPFHRRLEHGRRHRIEPMDIVDHHEVLTIRWDAVDERNRERSGPQGGVRLGVAARRRPPFLR
jgi:hypothetical protein